ncbi:MAG: maleylpyruvate isomerase N-terminal domain-containing protein [Chloroflexi bacterium]|nr:maleylpyruvate isomerase N-terminal domain-containing protein [Chloroflexota bacterium]
MYMQAMEFLEDEREAWAPFEALASLSDVALERPTDADGPAQGWTARDLMGHLVGWQEIALQMARELAVDDQSEMQRRIAQPWETYGEALNERMLHDARALSADEVRQRFADIPAELRGTLTMVPEARWLKAPAAQRLFTECTMEHYEDHQPALRAVLAAATPDAAPEAPAAPAGTTTSPEAG